jgi:nitrile hydratase subunit alpha
MTTTHDAHQHDHHHHGPPPSEIEVRVRALESLLLEKGVIDQSAIDTVVSTFENDLGPMIGARIVARAWTDPGFRERLLADATQVVGELGRAGMEARNLVAVANDEQTHNVVVCTLCSCYPWALLGLPPRWYKSPDYRARVVSEPRKVLEEFGLRLDDDVRIRVWDSSADMRYLVIPQRPAGTAGMSVEELAELVTRDSMIGVGVATSPA